MVESVSPSSPKKPKAATSKKPSKLAKIKAPVASVRPADPFAGYSTMANPIDRKHAELAVRVQEVLDGRTKLLIVYGPPGIAKSVSINRVLARHYFIEKKKWEVAERKPPRRTTMVQDEFGRDRLAFRAPFSVVQGGYSFPMFFCAAYWASDPNEVIFVDDVITLGDRRIQSFLQQATDPTHNGRVRYGYRVQLPDEEVPKEYNFHGGIIICTNFRKGLVSTAKHFAQLFPQPVIDRATEVEFPWERNALFDYINREAFVKRGLLKYLRAPTDPLISDDQRGLGFVGSDEIADEMLSDVQSYFHHVRNRIVQVSFRWVRDVMKDRFLYPSHWKQLTESNRLRALPIKR